MFGRILRQILRIAPKADRVEFAQNLLRENSSEYRAYSDLFVQPFCNYADWRCDFGDSKYVVYSIVRFLRPETIVQIGSARGLSACAMSLACRQNACGKVFAVDPNDRNSSAESVGSSQTFLKKAIDEYELTDWCEIISSTSCETSRNWDRLIDVLLIDGDQTYDGVRRNFDAFKNWLTDHSIVIFHDSLWEYHKRHGSYRPDVGVPRYLEELRNQGYQSVTMPLLPGLTLLYPIKGGFVFAPPLSANHTMERWTPRDGQPGVKLPGLALASSPDRKVTLTFRHSGNVGDVIYSLPTIKALLARAGLDRGKLLLMIDRPATYAPWVKHPLGEVRMNKAFAEKLLPLLRQPYLEADVFTDQAVDIDLDEFRRTGFDHTAGNMARYYCHVWPVCPVLWEPWLTVEPDPDYTDCIVVNRTGRYHHPNLSYACLSRYRNVRFIGLLPEYLEWCKTYNLVGVPHCPTSDFLEVARAISACKLFIGNQSSCFAIAEALKVPRILEVCPQVPNVSPCGPGGYEVYRQEAFETLVAEISNSAKDLSNDDRLGCNPGIQ